MENNGELSVPKNNARAKMSETSKGAFTCDISGVKFYEFADPGIGSELPEVKLSPDAERLFEEWSTDPEMIGDIDAAEDPEHFSSRLFQLRVLAQLTTVVKQYPAAVKSLNAKFDVPPTLDAVKSATDQMKYMDDTAKEFYDLLTSVDWWMPEDLKKHFWKQYCTERDAVKYSRTILRKRNHNAVIWAMGRCKELRQLLVGEGEFGLLGWELLHMNSDGVVVEDTTTRRRTPKKKSNKKGKEKEKVSAEDVAEEEMH